VTAPIVSRPTPLALALSHIYGVCRPYALSPLRWFPCPECSKTGGRRLTVCKTCDGSGRLAVL
jgi:hypothetical protein